METDWSLQPGVCMSDRDKADLRLVLTSTVSPKDVLLLLILLQIEISYLLHLVLINHRTGLLLEEALWFNLTIHFQPKVLKSFKKILQK